MATKYFSWEINPAENRPTGVSRMIIIIGLDEWLPDGITDEDFVMHIDPALPIYEEKNRVVCACEWGEILRLPTTGPLSRDNVHIRCLNEYRVEWYGNVKLFPTIYDLMIASSHYADSSKYYLVDSARKIVRYMSGYNPISGDLPPKFENEIERERWKSIALGVLWYNVMYLRSGIRECKEIVRHNLYSVFSTHTSVIILAVAYYGIFTNGDGTFQEKFDRYAEVRILVADVISESASKLSSNFNAETYTECVNAINRI